MQKNSNIILQSIIRISTSTHEGKIDNLTKAAVKKNTNSIQEKFHCTADEAVFLPSYFHCILTPDIMSMLKMWQGTWDVMLWNYCLMNICLRIW